LTIRTVPWCHGCAERSGAHPCPGCTGRSSLLDAFLFLDNVRFINEVWGLKHTNGAASCSLRSPTRSTAFRVGHPLDRGDSLGIEEQLLYPGTDELRFASRIHRFSLYSENTPWHHGPALIERDGSREKTNLFLLPTAIASTASFPYHPFSASLRLCGEKLKSPPSPTPLCAPMSRCSG